uniref:Alanine racemase-like protein n=1 Tax=Adineta vaga TaxID=104782 RepID=B3G456_ADIVA|nr:alanine racemase-like protein [Adineta vaga]
MRIDLNAMRCNLEQFCSIVASTTKMMMMVKASAYGVGIKKIGKWAEKTRLIDYLAVVYTAEGVELRKANIHLPIMVINIDKEDFKICQEYNLELVIYSISLLQQLMIWLEKNTQICSFPSIHVKINTGMNRLGLDIDEIPAFLNILFEYTRCRLMVKSIYTHVAASDDPQEDQYTAEQTRAYLSSVHILETGLGYTVLKHMCNSMGILRHPNLHFDMVRVGGGLYGAAECFLPYMSTLLPAISMMSTVTQVRHVKKDSTIGYNRRGRVNRDSFIGIIRLGYADGLRRQLGNGHGHVWIHDCQVPFIGSICMDFAMIDLTDVPVDNKYELENESVEIFGSHNNIEEIARCSDTIVFDFISTIGKRVKRVYIEDEKNKEDF